MGRPTELTPAVAKLVLEAARAGNRASACFRYAGLSVATGNEWLARGRGEDKDRKKNELYASFAADFDRAVAQCEVLCVAAWKKEIPNDWKAARDFLKTRFADDWTPVEKTELSGPDGGPVKILRGVTLDDL